ncbi:MAG: tetratricopeptide repeat protein [Hyphomonadaceae bacterium]|nr:tetratricopeptide repeat protein [Hyphomonadaceae bacterium]
MLTPITVILAGALLAGAAAFWMLRSMRRAGGDAKAARAVLFAVAGASVMALGVYLVNGRPDLPGAAYTARLQALAQRPVETYTADEALAVLAERARATPDDPIPQLYSGEILLSSGRPQEAARAFDSALRRDPQSADALIGLAKAMVAIDGRFTPESLAMLEQASALTNAPTPWIYRAMAAMERDDGADTRRMWSEALSRMSADDPRREMARRFASGEQP